MVAWGAPGNAVEAEMNGVLQVISNRMQKSVLVAVERFVKNEKYDRVLRRTTKLMVGTCLQHDSAVQVAVPRYSQTMPTLCLKCRRMTRRMIAT